MSLLTAYWRFRAEEVRNLADEMKDAKTKFMMARFAEDYERIAKLFANGVLKLQTSPLAQTDKAKVVEVVSRGQLIQPKTGNHADSECRKVS